MNAGVDEAGKGCIYGPVYAAAVIWDDNISHIYLKDSKKLSKKQKSVVYDFILENAIDYGIGYSTAKEIDKIGIHKANINAMHRALDGLSLNVDKILVDGNVFIKYKDIEYKCVIGGDNIHKNIMAASILAKVSHDKCINELVDNNEDLEKYNLRFNVGYCTKAHIDAVKMYGRTSHHRHSFKLPFEKHTCFID